MVGSLKLKSSRNNVLRRCFTKKFPLFSFLLLTALYSFVAVKEQRWNFFIPENEKDLFAQDSSSSLLRYGNVCISHLVPNTKMTHESNSCLQQEIFKKEMETKQTSITKKQHKKILNVLEQKVKDRISKLQNPPDCSGAKLLACHVSSGHGFGSLMHLLGECFLIALRTNRTMVTEVPGLWYGNMDDALEPSVSKNCSYRSTAKAVEWKDQEYDELHNVDVLRITIFELKDPKFSPFNMPSSIAEPLQCCHGDPNAWWTGQIMKYFVRPLPWVEKEIMKAKERIGFSHPIVGLHVRRTDKKIESHYQYLKTYMSHAIKWYECNYSEKGINTIKKIYLATDDPAIVNEAKTKYPDFEFLHDPYINQHLMYWWNRFSKDGVLGVATDVMLLKESDFFIGTYSSNLGRLVYELRQAEDERTFDAVSLDSAYHYHRGYPMWHIAEENHEPQGGEIELQIGDKIAIAAGQSTLITGYGIKERTKSPGKYPIKKVRPYINTIFYPGFT